MQTNSIPSRVSQSLAWMGHMSWGFEHSYTANKLTLLIFALCETSLPQIHFRIWRMDYYSNFVTRKFAQVICGNDCFSTDEWQPFAEYGSKHSMRTHRHRNHVRYSNVTVNIDRWRVCLRRLVTSLLFRYDTVFGQFYFPIKWYRPNIR